jgi:cyclophilin family peptidyl-prolyl cis-trans isomerase
MNNHKFNSSTDMTRIISTFLFALLVTMSGSLNAMSPRQDSEASLAELQKKWKEIDTKLVAKEGVIKSGEGDIKAAQAEFKSLVDEANEVIKDIEKTALAGLKAEPENQEIVRTLMGIMLNDAQQNRDAKVLAIGDTLIANGVNPEYFTIASRSDRLAIPSRELFDELLIRHAEAMKNDLPRVKFTTTKGDIVVELFENEAPNSVANFVSLVEDGFYSDILFHRVIEEFMAQTGGFKLEGDKEVGGEGPGYEIACECYTPDKRMHFSGSLSMAHRGKDTGGSQFFLTFERTGFLDGRHTCFGRVIEGFDVLEMLARTHIGQNKSGTGRDEPIPNVTKDKIISAEVLRKRDHKYRPKKIGGEEEPEEKVEPKKEAKDEEEKKDASPELSAPEESQKMKAEESGDDDKKEEPKKEEASDEAPAPKKEAEPEKESEAEESDSQKADGKEEAESEEKSEEKSDDKKDDKDSSQ